MYELNEANLRMIRRGAALASLLLVGVSSPAIAGPVGPIVTFESGKKALAGEVNGNFEAVREAVDDNAERIDALEGTADGDADTLGGFSADALLRADHVEAPGSINDFGETAFSSVIDLAATAPGSGFLMVWAHLNAEYDFNSEDGANVDLDCRIAVDGEAASIVVDQEFANVEGGTNSGESVAVSTVAPIASGSHSVELECRTTGAGRVFVKARSLSTLYVPFGSVSR